MGYEPIFFDIETTGLNPMAQSWWNGHDLDARVTAIGVGNIENWREANSHKDGEYNVDVLWDESEYRLLQVAHDRLVELATQIQSLGHEPFLVSFNGRQFDHPYLGARYARLRLDGGLWHHSIKRLDMMRALGKHWDPVDRYPSEDDCLEIAGIESDDAYDGSDMPQAYKDKDWTAIQSHVSHDVEEMLRLFIETEDECLEEFYDHYDIEQDVANVEEWNPDE